MVMDPKPPRPTWVVAHDLLANLAAAEPESSRVNHNSSERAALLMEELVSSMEEIDGLQELDHAVEASFQRIGSRPLRVPPASKEVVSKLPIVIVSEEIVARLGSETECAVCREKLVKHERMQEMPCKHLFHPICLEPWLDKHNSCPICRHELPTDDHAYESWKAHEAQDERKGATNASHSGILSRSNLLPPLTSAPGQL